jgi:hypothetical protein
MNNQNRTSSLRRGQIILRIVIGLAAVTAGGLAYLMSGANRLEAAVAPAILLAVLALGVAVYSRARNRQQWLAAWEEYAAREIGRRPHKITEDEEPYSLVGAN